MVIRGEISEEYKLDDNLIFRRNVGLYSLSGVGTVLLNMRDLEYSATASSTVSLICIPISEIREIISKKTKMEAILFKDIFLLNINLKE